MYTLLWMKYGLQIDSHLIVSIFFMFTSESKDIINILMYKVKGLSLDLIIFLRHTKQV
jgi:hypothetical protein